MADKFTDVDLTKVAMKPTDPGLFVDLPIGEFKCDGCDKTQSHPMKRCGGCKNVQYCGTECQVNHWVKHQPACVH